jgi:hypothetical protein
VEPDLFTEAERLRDAGLRKVEANSDGWINLALIALHQERREALKAGNGDFIFTVNNIKSLVLIDVGKPHHHNAWGALVKAAMKKGLIVDTGGWIRSTEPKSHARRIPTYRWGDK